MDFKSIGTIAVTGLIGAGAALGLSMFGAFDGAVAEETTPGFVVGAKMDPIHDPVGTLNSPMAQLFPAPMDTSKLLKWNFEVDPGVSLEPIRQSTVKKIAFGRVSTVGIVETATGVYSSDALTDPHVRYPGITATPKYAARTMMYWNGHGWTRFWPRPGKSFITVVPYDGGQLVVTDDGSCIISARSVVC